MRGARTWSSRGRVAPSSAQVAHTGSTQRGARPWAVTSTAPPPGEAPAPRSWPGVPRPPAPGEPPGLRRGGWAGCGAPTCPYSATYCSRDNPHLEPSLSTSFLEGHKTKARHNNNNNDNHQSSKLQPFFRRGENREKNALAAAPPAVGPRPSGGACARPRRSSWPVPRRPTGAQPRYLPRPSGRHDRGRNIADRPARETETASETRENSSKKLCFCCRVQTRASSPCPRICFGGFSPNIELLLEGQTSPAAERPDPQTAAVAAASPLGPELQPGLPEGPEIAPRALRLPTPGRGTATPGMSGEITKGKGFYNAQAREDASLHSTGSGLEA
ncbi:uncharacterized protein [Aphelocoma coerulescens]|uniref:uncharacterized protein n=1 Tax=Aphelocoma coerulescens TaxID=39617 RepID=UPI003604357E